MKVSCVWEHNGNDSLVYAEHYTGAYARGSSLQEALGKLQHELVIYAKWRGLQVPGDVEFELSQDRSSALNIADADSDVLFDSERVPLSAEEYEQLKHLALKSAVDFLALYDAVPDKHSTSNPERMTFYGKVPGTAYEMYEHTKNVNAYYFGEIGVDADNDGDIVSCRRRGFVALERQSGFLANPVTVGSYGEEWSLRKVLRRFVWHDRIHAKAMVRMARRTFPLCDFRDPFGFDE